MSLRFGNRPVLVVSSADAACEIKKTHDVAFSSRPKLSVFRKLLYDCKEVGSARYGEYWRQMKSRCVLNLLSNKRVQSYRAIREEETALAMENIQKSCSSGLTVNLSELFPAITNNNIGDYLPWLAWVSHVNGFNAKADKLAKELDEFLDRVIEEHMNRQNKKICLLQNEVRKVSSGKSSISEDDLDNLHYLKAVIKETLRLHPPVPLLLPIISTKDVKIQGYDIIEGTQVIINVWAIGRDPSSWEKPEEFIPDRFLNNAIDFKGHHFELIPFGSGRRICPGILFAMQINEGFLANLVHKFDWSLLGGANDKDLDMTESLGLAIHKSSPLIAIANQCSF
ncbi:cytochrome P450 71A4-like [Hibiscus syriacus]|uniref:cytochrome P450 71A4-like n=1 Tax=Hibiscus syriacus TaxID=106335 RepID=UPI0019247B59|nr:cytochrome P450 71A4-like [Hibiscus syriacus]